MPSNIRNFLFGLLTGNMGHFPCEKYMYVHPHLMANSQIGNVTYIPCGQSKQPVLISAVDLMGTNVPVITKADNTFKCIFFYLFFLKNKS